MWNDAYQMWMLCMCVCFIYVHIIHMHNLLELLSTTIVIIVRSRTFRIKKSVTWTFHYNYSVTLSMWCFVDDLHSIINLGFFSAMQSTTHSDVCIVLKLFTVCHRYKKTGFKLTIITLSEPFCENVTNCVFQNLKLLKNLLYTVNKKSCMDITNFTRH